ncbi:hypothetical protein LINPERHAP2_LOCUS9963 [Linum perenne]
MPNHLKSTPSFVNDLPHDLHVKILSHVASSSLTDLFNARLTCKLFHEAGTHRIVLQNVDVWRKFCSVQFRPRPDQAVIDGVTRFVTQCVDSGSLEALFCLGINDCYFSGRGEGNLKAAAAKGHVAAKYTLAVRRGEDLLKILGIREGEEVSKFLERTRPEGERNFWDYCRVFKLVYDLMELQRRRKLILLIDLLAAEGRKIEN